MSSSSVIALASALYLMAFTLILFVFIVLRRVITDRLQARFSKIYHHIEADVLEAMSRGRPEFSVQVARRHQEHASVFTRVLLDYGNLITGEGREQLQIMFDLAAKKRCLRALRSRRWTRRLQNARLFVTFFSPDDRDVLPRLLGDKPLIRLAVISALSQTPSPDVISYLFQAFERDTGPAVKAYVNIMFSLGERIEPFLRQYLGKPLPVEKLELLVEVAGAIPVRSVWRDVERLAAHPEKEIRIKVARALGNLLIPETLPTLITLASDREWEVQSQAIKSLGRMKNPETIELLTRALFSPHWYVRLNAARSLAEIGEPGLRQLERVAAQDEDRYAREMSEMVLSELIQFSVAG